MTTFLSDIKPYDVFYLANKKHYYVCIYTQSEDQNNALFSDIYCAIITTNSKYKKLLDENRNDYNVEIQLNGITSYVCCDKLFRIPIDDNLIKKSFNLKQDEIKNIKLNINKFLNEIKRQIEV